MNQKLYFIYDSKSETFTAPTVNPARGQALRSFSDAVNSKDQPSVLSQHPADFTLYEIGDFNPYTGDIVLYDARKAVANGLDVKVDESLN